MGGRKTTVTNYCILEQREVNFAAMVVPEKGKIDYQKHRVLANRVDGKP
jgi:hypothetical protein